MKSNKNNKKNKNKKIKRNNNRDISIRNTKRIISGQGNQIYGFGRNVVIISDTMLFQPNTFSRVSLGQLFALPEFNLRKDFFKYFKVNHVMCLVYPTSQSTAQLMTLMFEWRNPTLVEGDILNNDSARTIGVYSTKNRYYTWRPPNTVIDNNLVYYMNKPQEIGYASEYPGWLYVKTGSTAIQINFSMNITFISNNLNYQETAEEKKLRAEMLKDKYKLISIPAKEEAKGI